MKISDLYSSRMRNDEHFQCYTEINEQTIMEGVERLKIEPQYAEFLTLYEEEDKILKIVAKSAFTQRIHKAGKMRKSLITGMSEIFRANQRYHYLSAGQEAAREIMIVMNAYKNAANKTLLEKTAAVYNLVQELEQNQAANIERFAMIHWLQQLKLTNEAIDALMRERDEEKFARPTRKMAEIRPLVDNAFRKIADKLFALAQLDENRQMFVDFIRRINLVIQKYNARVYARKNRF